MPTPFIVDIVTPDRVIIENQEAVSLVAPGVEGYLGILAHHAPLVTQLGVGELRYKTDEGDEARVAVSGGFLQVANNRVTVMADAAERAQDIDVERARRSLERAREERRGAEGGTGGIRARELDEQIERAENRLKVASGGTG